MRYAIFSDIHDNIYALRAALADAKAQGADEYIFLGDYTNSFPWGNEVVDTIRGIKSISIIRGNGESYLADLKRQSPKNFTLEQFKPVYWAHEKLSNENLEYLLSLPCEIDLPSEGELIHLQHPCNIFYRSERIAPFHSSMLREIMPSTFSRKEYVDFARNAILSREDALADIRALPTGVYLFGHNHLQFNMDFEGRLFVNPGSCGEALDWDTTAAYTLLERINENWLVNERRVKYDLNEAIMGFSSSGYSGYTPVWSKVMELELTTGKDYFFRFVMHLTNTGRKLGKTEYPVSNEVWDIAVKDLDLNSL